MSDRPSKSPSRDGSPRRTSRSRSPRRSLSRSRSPPRRRERDYRSRSRSLSPRDGANQGNCLHFSGLNSRTIEADLEDACARYGKVLSVKLIKDPRTNDSRGFAFVTMDSSAAADTVLDKLDGTDLDNRKIAVQKARRGQPRDSTPGKYLGFSKGSGYGGYRGGYGDSRYGRGRYDDRRGRDYDDRGYRDDRYRDDRDDRYRDDRYDDRRYDDRGYNRSPSYRQRSRSR